MEGADKLKEHISEMREKAKIMELDAREMIAVAKAIRAESFTLENRFEDVLWPKKQQ